MSIVQIMVNKLTAKYCSNCHFKIKIVVSSSPNKESVEIKHSLKYEKGTSEINIYEKLDLKPNSPLTSESKLHFFLEVYTKTGYKTAGVGKFNLYKGVMINVPIQIEIQKCPLGKGYLEIQFLNFNLNPAPKKIHIPKQLSKDNLSFCSDNSFLSNVQNCDISNISSGTNINNKPATSTYNSNHNKSTNNIFRKTTKNYSCNNSNKKTYNIQNTNYNNNTNINEDIIKEKDRYINELKTKIDYYEEENNELKNLVNDFKKEKKVLNEEKNKLINQQKEKLQEALNEKDELETKCNSLEQNLNLLQNDKNDLDEKVINIKAKNEKQINNLMQQIKNLNNIKLQLENENKEKEDKIFNLDKKVKEITINYQKKLSELTNNYSIEKNTNFVKYNENLKIKEEENAKLKIKINSMKENINSLNELIEINKKQKNEKEEMTENMTKLLEQISSKDKEIFDLKIEVSELNNKIITEQNNIKTQDMLKNIREKELKNEINNLQNIINEKDNELTELRTKYDNLKYNLKRYQPKIHYIEESDDDDNNVDSKSNGNNEVFLKQINEIEKTYKEREEKLIKEKDEEIKKLKDINNDLITESHLENNNKDIKKYIKEIKRLKALNNNLEEDLGYYKDLNSKFVENEKRTLVYESENVKLQNLLQLKKDEIDSMIKKHKKLEEENSLLEKQLVNSKGKLGEVLNELVEVESKCVAFEGQKRKISKSCKNGVKKL